MYGTLIEDKKNFVKGMELTVTELLAFIHEPLAPESVEESKTQCTTRLNKISAAKTKAIENISNIQAKIKEENDLIAELEGNPVAAPGVTEEKPKEKDVSIRRPESN